MTYFRYLSRSRPLRLALGLLLTLLLAGTAMADAQSNQKNKNQKNKTNQSQQAQQNPPAPAGNAPSEADKRVDETLRKVDRKLLAYATGAARDELGDLAKDPGAGPLTALGRIYEQEKNYGEATRCLTKAGELAPADPAPFAYLGEAYLHQKRQSEATSAFREVEKRARALASKDANDAEAHYYLGLAQQRLGQLGPAAQSLEKARQLDAQDPLPVYQLGVNKAFEQKWQESVDLLTKALELNPNLAYAYYYRGQSASKLNHKDMLIADLERFLELAPDSPEAPIARRTIASARR